MDGLRATCTLGEQYNRRLDRLDTAVHEASRHNIANQRRIAELERTYQEHLRTCPADKNELMLQQGETTTIADVCVVAGETVFPVHRAVLASRYSIMSP